MSGNKEQNRISWENLESDVGASASVMQNHQALIQIMALCPHNSTSYSLFNEYINFDKKSYGLLKQGSANTSWRDPNI